MLSCSCVFSYPGAGKRDGLAGRLDFDSIGYDRSRSGTEKIGGIRLRSVSGPLARLADRRLKRLFASIDDHLPGSIGIKPFRLVELLERPQPKVLFVNHA